MNLIDLDDFKKTAGTGKSTILRILEKYAMEHPVIDVPVDAYQVHISLEKKAITLEKIEQ
jgi:hypothetical protein